MGVAKACVKAVAAAGAVTAGVAATNIVVAPDQADVLRPVSADVDLAASITIPILNIEPDVGPVTISRQILLTLTAEANKLAASLFSKGGTIYDLPGLYTNYADSATQTVQALRTADGLEFGFKGNQTNTGKWNVLNGFATGDDSQVENTGVAFSPLFGGSQGIGAALDSKLVDVASQRDLTLLNSGIGAGSHIKGGEFVGQLSTVPFSGLKAAGDGTLGQGEGGVEVKLGSFEFGGGGHGQLSGGAGLCLGSAAASCGNRVAYANFAVPVDGRLHTGPTSDESTVVAFDIPTKLAADIGNGQLSVTGELGGTVSIGNITLGRKIPVNIHIPGAANATLSTFSEKSDSTPTVKTSLKAIPQKLAGDNDTGGRHRAPFGTAVSDIKASISDAVHGRHAAKESGDAGDNADAKD